MLQNQEYSDAMMLASNSLQKEIEKMAICNSKYLPTGGGGVCCLSLNVT